MYQVPGLVDANQFCDVSEAFDAVRDRPVTVGIGCYHSHHSRVLVNMMLLIMLVVLELNSQIFMIIYSSLAESHLVE